MSSSYEKQKCCSCGKESRWAKTQWWYLNGYYEITGLICSICFKKVAHRNNKPNHPVAYRNIKKRIDSLEELK